MPDRPTPDQFAEKVHSGILSDGYPVPRPEHTDAAFSALHDLLALAKQGEAFDAALAHARSLYTNTEQPTTEELAERVIYWLDAAERTHIAAHSSQVKVGRDALSELVVRAHGHVPCEAFAAAMTALEAARMERDVDQREIRSLVAEADSYKAERDRLAAALERIAHRDLTLTGYTDGCKRAQSLAREALAQAPQEQTCSCPFDLERGRINHVPWCPRAQAPQEQTTIRVGPSPFLADDPEPKA